MHKKVNSGKQNFFLVLKKRQVFHIKHQDAQNSASYFCFFKIIFVDFNKETKKL